jgi:hypothetical protein
VLCRSCGPLGYPSPAQHTSRPQRHRACLPRTQGLWRASVRFAYVYGALRDEPNLAALSTSGGASRLWSQSMLQKIVDVFEHTWSALVAEAEANPPPLSDARVEPGVASRCRSAGVAKALPAKMASIIEPSSSEDSLPTLSSAEIIDAAEKAESQASRQLRKKARDDVRTLKPPATCKPTAADGGGQRSAVTMASLSAPMIAAVEPLMQELLLDGGLPDADEPLKLGGACYEPLPPACRSVAAVSAFVEAAVHAFVTNDLYSATRQLLGGAKVLAPLSPHAHTPDAPLPTLIWPLAPCDAISPQTNTFPRRQSYLCTLPLPCRVPLDW